MGSSSNIRRYFDRKKSFETEYNYLYYIAFAAFCFWRSISYININQFLIISIEDLSTLAKFIMLISLAVKLLLQRYDLRSIAIIGLCLLLLLLSSRTSSSKQLIWLFLFICAAQGVQLKPLARICLWFYAGALILGVTGWFVGDVEAIEALRFSNEGTRSSLGFRHPNSFGYITMTICFSWMVLKFPTFRVRDFAIVIVAALAVNVIAGSRTSVLAMMFGLIVAFAYGFSCKTEKGKRSFVVLSALVLAALLFSSLLCMAYYDPSNGLFAELNRLLSSRLSYANFYFSNYSLALIGSNIPQNLLLNTTDAASGFVVDNAFCNLILRYGIIPMILFVAAWIGVYIKAFNEAYWGPCVLALTLWIVVAFAESTVLIFASNFGFVAAGSLLYGYPLASLDEKENGS